MNNVVRPANTLNIKQPSQQHPSGITIQAPSASTRTQALLHGDERFRILVESVRDYAIFFLDVQGRVVDWNIGAERILGYTDSEIIGQPADIIYTTEDRAQHVPEQELATAMHDGRAEDERWHVRKDGTRFWGSGTVTALHNEAGELIGYAKVMRDFTERKAAEQERVQLIQRELQAREEAEAANRAKDEFIALVAHEMRTPIGVAMGWLEILLKDDADPETKARAVATIKRSQQAQNQIINDLLDISRIATGKISLNPVPTDLAALVSSTVESIRPVAEIKTVQLEVKIGTGIESVVADADRLQQVLLNLLGNAVKFTPEQGRIEVQLQRVKAHYALKITDTGIGISAEQLPRIFERYHQSAEEGAGKQSGLGLGLWLVRHIVELHGGTVHASSEGKGKGATFTVELPLSPVGAHPPAVQKA